MFITISHIFDDWTRIVNHMHLIAYAKTTCHLLSDVLRQSDNSIRLLQQLPTNSVICIIIQLIANVQMDYHWLP